MARPAALLGWIWRRLTGRADPVILMYHRVARAPVDPWGLAVEPEIFEQHMKVLAKTRRPVPLDWLAAELRAGRQPARAVAVTFDDAYGDVLQHAKPSLVRHGIPATVFVVSGAVGSQRGYWWDELAEIVLGAPATPERIPLPFEAPEVEAARASGNVERLHMALWRSLRAAQNEARSAALDAIANAYGVPRPTTALVMTEDELRRLTEGGLISLGVHTVTHPSLPDLSAADQQAEISDCRAQVERLTGAPNRRLAYPFGDFDGRSVEIAEALGFDYAVSVNAGPAIDWKQRFELPRYDVKNWPEAVFRRKLRWFG